MLALSISPISVNADTLRIAGIDPGDSVVVLWRGRTGTGCSDNFTALRSTGVTELPNLLPDDGDCASEIAIFSEKHAMVHEEVDTWTDDPADVHTVTLKPVIPVPVNVWTASNADEQRARRHMAVANRLYQKNKVGIRFEPVYRRAPNNLLEGLAADRCRGVETVRSSSFYTANALNVYYVDSAVSGRNCAIRETPPDCQTAKAFPAADGNITYIGSDATVTTLAHEFGHAFGLRPSHCGGHTNPEETPELGPPAGAPDNIMWAAGGEERTHFTLGQVFRMNTHSDQWGGTMLIKNDLRPGPGRSCLPIRTSRLCPALNTPWP